MALLRVQTCRASYLYGRGSSSKGSSMIQLRVELDLSAQPSEKIIRGAE